MGLTPPVRQNSPRIAGNHKVCDQEDGSKTRLHSESLSVALPEIPKTKPAVLFFLPPQHRGDHKPGDHEKMSTPMKPSGIGRLA